jgi:hypothetical protein
MLQCADFILSPIGLEEARIRMDILSFLLVRTKHELPFLAW